MVLRPGGHCVHVDDVSAHGKSDVMTTAQHENFKSLSFFNALLTACNHDAMRICDSVIINLHNK